MSIDANQYPALAKMESVQDESQTIGQFLEWLQENGMVVCSGADGLRGSQYWPILEGTEALLARFFEVDLKEVEKERRRILDSIQSAVTSS